MADSYLTVSVIAESTSMTNRVAACAAQQGQVEPPADHWAGSHRWEWASTPGWAEAWDYAVATHPPVEGQPEYDPGADPAVITDPMILTRVQQMLGIGG